jgi:myo-inositol-1(or 4)-monophosphatase
LDVEALVPELERTFRGVRDVARSAFRAAPSRPGRKEDGTVVTALDHELESRLAAALLALDDDWGVVGEEGGTLRAGNPAWHLDALDGTLNFSRRIPLFVCQAALVDGDEPLLAVIYDPLRDVFAWAARDRGAWEEGSRLRVSRRPVEEALLLVDVARSGAFVQRPDLLPKLRRGVFRVRALGCAGLHLLSVAAGRADAFFGSRGRPSPLYDVAPGVLFIQEAGGLVTSGEGGPPLQDRRTLLAAHPDLHAALQTLLR